MISTRTSAALVGALALLVAAGVLAGAAAAEDHGGEDDEWTIAFDGEVDVEDNGGDGGFTCTGMPTDHDCDKGSDFYAGPVTVDYDGYNRGSLDGGEYEFEDRFVVTDEDGQGAVVVVPCEFEDDAPEDNPCPVTAEEYEGDQRDGDRGNGGQGGDGDAGGDGGADASDDRRDNGNDDGNGNDDDNASDQRDGEDDSDDPVDVDVTVDPPSDGPSL